MNIKEDPESKEMTFTIFAAGESIYNLINVILDYSICIYPLDIDQGQMTEPILTDCAAQICFRRLNALNDHSAEQDVAGITQSNLTTWANSGTKSIGSWSYKVDKTSVAVEHRISSRPDLKFTKISRSAISSSLSN